MNSTFSKITNITFALLYMGVLYFLSLGFSIAVADMSEPSQAAINWVSIGFYITSVIGVIAMWARIITPEKSPKMFMYLVWLPIVYVFAFFSVSYLLYA